MRLVTSSPRINADSRGLIHAELTEKIIGIFYEVYNELGHGFLESVYEEALSIALAERNVFFQRQIGTPVSFRGRQIGDLRRAHPGVIFLDLARFLQPAQQYYWDMVHVYDEANMILAEKVYQEIKPLLER